MSGKCVWDRVAPKTVGHAFDVVRFRPVGLRPLTRDRACGFLSAERGGWDGRGSCRRTEPPEMKNAYFLASGHQGISVFAKPGGAILSWLS